LRGEVTVRNEGVEPQPRDAPIRPAGFPLRGAKITGFDRDDEKKIYTLKYELQDKTLSWKYTINKDDTFTFVYTDANGEETTETYHRRERKEGDQLPKKDGPPKKGGPPPPRNDIPPAPPKKEEIPAPKPPNVGKFKLTSPAFEAGGKMPAEFTGEGDGVSPPVAWSGVPEGTKFYALQLCHKPMPNGDEVKSYWVVTNIPTTTTALEKNSKGVGKDGYNDKKRTGYDPMNSKGPGPKEYHITMYALSAEPKFDTDKTTRADLLKAIKGITLAETTLSYTYERKGK